MGYDLCTGHSPFCYYTAHLLLYPCPDASMKLALITPEPGSIKQTYFKSTMLMISYICDHFNAKNQAKLFDLIESGSFGEEIYIKDKGKREVIARVVG